MLGLVAGCEPPPDRSVGRFPWLDATEAAAARWTPLVVRSPVDGRDDEDLQPEENHQKSQVDGKGCPRSNRRTGPTTGSTNLPTRTESRTTGDLGSRGNHVRTAYPTMTSR